MPETTETTETVTPPASETPAAETSAEELKKQLADAQAQIKALNSESASRRKKLEAFEQAEAKKLADSLTDKEKAEKAIADAQTQLETLKAEKRALLLERSFDRTAQEIKVQFANDTARDEAFTWLDKATIEDDGAGMKEQLVAMQKKRPHLFKPASVPEIDAMEKGRVSNPLAANAAEILQKKRLEYPPL